MSLNILILVVSLITSSVAQLQQQQQQSNGAYGGYPSGSTFGGGISPVLGYGIGGVTQAQLQGQQVGGGINPLLYGRSVLGFNSVTGYPLGYNTGFYGPLEAPGAFNYPIGSGLNTLTAESLTAHNLGGGLYGRLLNGGFYPFGGYGIGMGLRGLSGLGGGYGLGGLEGGYGLGGLGLGGLTNAGLGYAGGVNSLGGIGSTGLGCGGICGINSLGFVGQLGNIGGMNSLGYGGIGRLNGLGLGVNSLVQPTTTAIIPPIVITSPVVMASGIGGYGLGDLGAYGLLGGLGSLHGGLGQQQQML